MYTNGSPARPNAPFRAPAAQYRDNALLAPRPPRRVSLSPPLAHHALRRRFTRSRTVRRAAFALSVLLLVWDGMIAQAEAMPVFAQRYQLTCKTCHTVLPELNDFGNDFRNRGYRLPP